MVVALVDDHRLLNLLVHNELTKAQYATTCSWWWRLVSAFAGRRSGAISRRLSRLGPGVAWAVRQAIHDLPSRCEIVDLRTLMPSMTALARDRPLNLLAAEAVAAAAFLGTSIEVVVDSDLLRAAAEAARVPYRVVR